MIRFLFRFLGLICLAAAFICWSMTAPSRSPAITLYLTSVRALWDLINASSLALSQAADRALRHGCLWDPAMLTFLQAPAGRARVLGIILILLGRKKKPLIGYARP